MKNDSEDAARFRKLERIQQSRGPLWYWIREGQIYANVTKGRSENGKFYRSLRVAVDAFQDPEQKPDSGMSPTEAFAKGQEILQERQK